MKYTIVFLIIIFYSCKAQEPDQKELSYYTLNEVVYDITKQKKGSKLFFNPRIVDLKDKLSNDYFGKTILTFVDGNNVALGVNSKKLKKLVVNTDIENIKITKPEQDFFETSKFNFPIKIVNQIEKGKSLSNPIYRFSNPVFFDNNKYCIIYYEYYCGIDCGEGNLMIFEKKSETWEIYMTLPIWIV
ncbi:MAG: hypothetical protein RI535_02415 [Psychroflexus sp.]|jgi:hypothetical protein|nr:hypothetical protein [Psychroflexus sp.]